MSFSVLLSIYHKENPACFDRSMESIWDDQGVKPSEIVLVKDGPLNTGLDSVLEKWKTKLGDVLKCVPLENNVGLGHALNIGMEYCSHELIARMDTDDVAKPDRFEKQLAIFEKYKVDVCGSWVSEFNDSEENITGWRRPPEWHAEIQRYSKFRCPVNHPTVMYKKKSVEKAGGYQEMMFFEDYYLWARMLLSGAVFYNIQEPLVHMRAGLGQLERRSGRVYAVKELILFNEFKKMGFFSRLRYWVMVALRLPVRLMPKPIVRSIYAVLRK